MIDQQTTINLAIKAGVIDSADINSVHIPQGYIDDLAEFAYLVEEKVCQLLEKLAEPEQEPVYQISLANCAAAAWIDVDEATYYSAKLDATYMARCLYSAPLARKPLTEPELNAIEPTWPNEWNYDDVLAFVRAIERAHGITE